MPFDKKWCTFRNSLKRRYKKLENRDFIFESICEFIEQKQPNKILEILEPFQPQDIAELLNDDYFEQKQKNLIFRLLKKDLAAQVFVELDNDMQENLIKGFSDNELHQMLNELFVDDAVDIIEEMPASVVKRILKNCTKDMRGDINDILAFSKDTAGSVMTPEYIALKLDMTVKEAFARIRKEGLDSETVYTCYVLDRSRHILGVITVRELLLAKEDQKINEIMNENVIFVETVSDKEEAAKILKKYDFLAVPVVDKEKRLVGIITVDDAIDVLVEETTEDISKMAAVTPIQQSYFKTGVFQHSLSRILWLIVLMISATVTGFIITYYENAFQAVPLLIACLPLLMGTGGNCGSQASTMVIRGLAVDEMSTKDVLKVWFKEIRISLVVGIVLAIVNTIRVFLLYGFSQEIILLAITNALALLFTVSLAQTLGCLLPIGAKVIKLDPAIMAAPLITTIVDALSVTVFFACAVWVFGM